jgi:circadian clock protein KaiC
MMMEPGVSPLKCLSTGSLALDRILGGGIPAHSVVVITGDPGTGKTILTLQLLFHLAHQGKRCLYFTSLSEPALKLIRYTQLFSFFDQRLIDDRFIFMDLGSTIRAQGAETALAEVAKRVAHDEPDLVAIDSFKAIHDLLGTPDRSRIFVYDLAVEMASLGATTLLVGEYAPEEVLTQSEFAIADGIVRLTNERQGLTAVRMLEILKLRGADYITGRHFFEINSDGLAVYSRVRTPDVSRERPISLAQRVTSGIEGLDALLLGGLPLASTTIVQGGTGTGKTLLSLQFLVRGTQHGEPGLLLTFEETPEQLRGIASAFGWDLGALEAQGLFQLRHTAPVELSPDRFLDQVCQQAEAFGARRVVLDGLTGLARGLPSEQRFREMIYALTKYFRLTGITLIMTLEVAELLGVTQLSGHGVSSLADNIFLLRYVEMAGHLERAISVLKARGIAHGTEVRRLVIAADGVSVGETFHEFRGVLTGLPIPTQRDLDNPAAVESNP